MTNKIAELKEIGFDNSEIKEIIQNVYLENEDDFEVGNYRFIADTMIDRIQRDELESDLYILGCFNAWFIADVLDIDVEVIEAMQESEAYEAIGKLIISMGKLDKLQAEYSSVDGYGHHFNHYDFNEDEVYINDELYHVFRTN